MLQNTTEESSGELEKEDAKNTEDLPLEAFGLDEKEAADISKNSDEVEDMKNFLN